MAQARRKHQSAKPVLPGSKLAAVPAFVAPCLALRQSEPPIGEAWVHEIKFDGYRMEARLEGGKVKLLTRNDLDWTRRFPRVAKAVATLAAETALLDGEIVVEREDGTTSFSDLVAELKAGNSDRMVYYVFDLLYLDGIDLRGSTLVDRKASLARLLSGRRNGAIRMSEHFATDGRQMLDKACALGLEGIICKRADKPYRSGRTGDWIKVTCHLTDEFVIGGYLDSTAQKEAIGALALGRYEKQRLKYVGRVGTGFSRETAAELWRAAQRLRRQSSPFADPLDTAQRRGVTWLSPKLVAQIEYRALTGDGLLRHASFKGLREDKPAKDVT